MLVTNQIGPAVPAQQNRDAFADDIAREVSEHAPVHETLDRDLHVDPV